MKPITLAMMRWIAGMLMLAAGTIHWCRHAEGYPVVVTLHYISAFAFLIAGLAYFYTKEQHG